MNTIRRRLTRVVAAALATVGLAAAVAAASAPAAVAGRNAPATDIVAEPKIGSNHNQVLV